MITAPRRQKYLSSGPNRLSGNTVTVNPTDEYNLMAVNPMIEWFSRDLVPADCPTSESCTVYIAHPFFTKSLPGRANTSLHCLLLNLYTTTFLPLFVTSNIYIRQCITKSFSRTRLWSYKMFNVLLVFRINKRVDHQGIINFHLLRDTFPHQLAREIPFKEEVLSPLQTKGRTAPPHLH